MVSPALLVIATWKVSATASVSVTAATPLATRTVTGAPTAAGRLAGEINVPVTNACTLPLKVGSKVIWVVLSVVTVLPPAVCTATPILVVPPTVKSAPGCVITT